MTLSGFSEVDHSGDVGIEATGRSFGELVENATRGLFGLMYRGAVAPVIERAVRIEGATADDILVDWLGEVITLAGVNGELYGEVAVTSVGPNRIEGVLRGEATDADRHDLRFDVKAATYHGLKVEEAEDGFRARVIFDL